MVVMVSRELYSICVHDVGLDEFFTSRSDNMDAKIMSRY